MIQCGPPEPGSAAASLSPAIPRPGLARGRSVILATIFYPGAQPAYQRTILPQVGCPAGCAGKRERWLSVLHLKVAGKSSSTTRISPTWRRSRTTRWTPSWPSLPWNITPRKGWNRWWTELMRVLKPGGVLLATLTAGRDQDWWHSASSGWCYTDTSLRRLFKLPPEAPSNYAQYDELFARLKDCAELRDNLARFYYQSADKGMPKGVWNPEYQPVGVCKIKRAITDDELIVKRLF